MKHSPPFSPDNRSETAMKLPGFPRAKAIAPATGIDGIVLRAAGEDDLPFLLALFAGFRAPELLLAPWSAEQKAAFVESQFALQHAHFVRHFPRADFWVIQREEQPIGRVYLDRSKAEWRLIEIGLATTAQGQGIGAALVRWIQASAAAAGRAVALSVAVNNPRARALYHRLGFADRPTDSGTHVEMVWSG